MSKAEVQEGGTVSGLDPLAPVYAPWTPEQIAKLEAWQGDPRLHQLTCEVHSHIPLVPTKRALRCDDPNCDYIQTWVPGVCVNA